jgi:hypothetical protein
MGDKFRRNRSVSIAVTEEEYDFLYEVAALRDESVSSRGRDLLLADALRYYSGLKRAS